MFQSAEGRLVCLHCAEFGPDDPKPELVDVKTDQADGGAPQQAQVGRAGSPRSYVLASRPVPALSLTVPDEQLAAAASPPRSRSRSDVSLYNGTPLANTQGSPVQTAAAIRRPAAVPEEELDKGEIEEVSAGVPASDNNDSNNNDSGEVQNTCASCLQPANDTFCEECRKIRSTKNENAEERTRSPSLARAAALLTGAKKRLFRQASPRSESTSPELATRQQSPIGSEGRNGSSNGKEDKDEQA